MRITNLYVNLPPSVRDLLIAIALREYRHPKQQAAMYLQEAILAAVTDEDRATVARWAEIRDEEIELEEEPS